MRGARFGRSRTQVVLAGAARACGAAPRGGCFAVAFSPGSDFCFLSGRSCSLFLTLSRFLLLRWSFLQLLPRFGCFPFLSRAVFAISFSSRMVSAPFVCRSCNCILRGVIVDGFPLSFLQSRRGDGHPVAFRSASFASALSWLPDCIFPLVVFAVASSPGSDFCFLGSCFCNCFCDCGYCVTPTRMSQASPCISPCGNRGMRQSHLTRRPGNRRFKSSC